MALLCKKKQNATLLDLPNPGPAGFEVNHIFEPEFHQDAYVKVCDALSKVEGAYQLRKPGLLEVPAHRGTQPTYADDENDEDSLEYEGMLLKDGSRLDCDSNKRNVCAIKSICVRAGFVDLDTARSVTRSFYEARKKKAGVQCNDVLINSTGDGTIGRVAVFNYKFPALADGHITILRFKKPEIAWYVAAFLSSPEGQAQIYRYINGSSGQVEIYPQDIQRLWIRPASQEKMEQIHETYLRTVKLLDGFQLGLMELASLVVAEETPDVASLREVTEQAIEVASLGDA